MRKVFKVEITQILDHARDSLEAYKWQSQMCKWCTDEMGTSSQDYENFALSTDPWAFTHDIRLTDPGLYSQRNIIILFTFFFADIAHAIQFKLIHGGC